MQRAQVAKSMHAWQKRFLKSTIKRVLWSSWQGDEMPLKDETMLAIGMISMALGILIGRFLHFEYSGFSVSDFVEGVFVGLSIVMNLAYLIRLRSKK